MNAHNPSLLDQLKAASHGLRFTSESESPFEAFLWQSSDKSLTTQTILQKTGHPSNTPVEVVDVDSFFEVATTEQDWQDAEERATAKKFQQLLELLKHHLNNIKVYRLGHRTIDVYIVGQDESGNEVGLSTKVVET